ncbi:FAD binding domain-containing protein [Desulfomonile tiedjei]|uniref:Aerobic-type carbon monoxide dehydrogenase, middle subunit CoxM/CutM-like protein n=1 Tax=Desulfomonile tiedjei (strain ATCC 49306 / DSM 6799 / DCB-1) TaxID=706587 RepID=I4C1H4_DESTA|nr:FAD binding domain-containing protein [Desulfomonile tiedjei]AFM23415.1 aerobic-type carbon monoxide dehydrogenase, middle subunit CoxM/CutM-like protein [Desulfomonile tiedjei DSM 6799]
MRWQNYHVMSNLPELLESLGQLDGRGRVVAGGTDLIVRLKETDMPSQPLTLLDVTRIDAMRGIKQIGDDIHIGAATTISEISNSPLIGLKARALAQGAGWLGSPQIRTVATIGGNVVNALPAADTSVPLVALGARARIVSARGERIALVEDLFRRVGESAIDPTREVVTEFIVKADLAPCGASAMTRMAKRKAFTLPILSAAVWIDLDKAGERFQAVRIVAAPVAPVPWRAKRAEEVISGREISSRSIEEAAALAGEDAKPGSSLRGGSAYRKDMVVVLVRRALRDALKQVDRVPHE